MDQAATERTEVETLFAEFIPYVEGLRSKWLPENRVHSRNVYEVMSDDERAKVHGAIRSWAAYITPISEAWWKERGYGITWPDDDSAPMQVYKLEGS